MNINSIRNAGLCTLVCMSGLAGFFVALCFGFLVLMLMMLDSHMQSLVEWLAAGGVRRELIALGALTGVTIALSLVTRMQGTYTGLGPIGEVFLDGLNRGIIFSIVVGFVAPAIVLIIDSSYSRGLFFSNCTEQDYRNRVIYTGSYIVDCLSKGAFADFLESYNLNFWSCAPTKGSFIVSSTTFALRGASTTVIVYNALSYWTRATQAIDEMRFNDFRVGALRIFEWLDHNDK
jgi:hypothetical protein